MRVQERLVSLDEFREFENRPENANKNFELINGVAVEMPPNDLVSDSIRDQIIRLISVFLQDHDLGRILGANHNFEVASNTALKPDGAFIAKARFPDSQEPLRFAPVLVIEVISSDLHIPMQQKIEAYLGNGTQLVWLVYPENQIVEVYTSAGPKSMLIQPLTADQMLDGGAVLPGFSVKVGELFPTIEKEIEPDNSSIQYFLEQLQKTSVENVPALVVHALRGLVNTIVGAATLLRQDRESSANGKQTLDSETVERAIDIIEHNARHTSACLEALLDFHSTQKQKNNTKN